MIDLLRLYDTFLGLHNEISRLRAQLELLPVRVLLHRVQAKDQHSLIQGELKLHARSLPKAHLLLVLEIPDHIDYAHRHVER